MSILKFWPYLINRIKSSRCQEDLHLQTNSDMKALNPQEAEALHLKLRRFRSKGWGGWRWHSKDEPLEKKKVVAFTLPRSTSSQPWQETVRSFTASQRWKQRLAALFDSNLAKGSWEHVRQWVRVRVTPTFHYYYYFFFIKKNKKTFNNFPQSVHSCCEIFRAFKFLLRSLRTPNKLKELLRLCICYKLQQESLTIQVNTIILHEESLKIGHQFYSTVFSGL